MPAQDDDVKSVLLSRPDYCDVTIRGSQKCEASGFTKAKRQQQQAWKFSNLAESCVGYNEGKKSKGTAKYSWRSSPGLACLVYRWLLVVQLLHMCHLVTADYYSGYMSTIIRSHTKSACEGQILYITCPVGSTIAVQSAMYGRKVPSKRMCPAFSSILDTPAPLRGKENTDCEAMTSYVKTAADCHGKRYCGLLVHHRVFGDDPCPGTTKYLTVNYKCRLMPDEFKKRDTCDEKTMVVRCARAKYVIAVYNVTMTHRDDCGNFSAANCSLSSSSALDKVTKLCHKRQRCAVSLGQNSCANFMHLDYACIPRRILTDRLPSSVLSATAAPEELTTTPELLRTTGSASVQTTKSGAVHPEIRTVIPPTPSTTLLTSSTTTATTTTTPTTASTSPTANVSKTTSRRSSKKVDKDAAAGDKSTENPAPRPSKRPPRKRKTTTSPFTPSSITIINHFAKSVAPPVASPAGNRSLNPRRMDSTTPGSFDVGASAATAIAETPNGDADNATVLFPVLRSFMAISSYITANSDRVLVVFLGCVCLGLFLTVCMLVCKIEERKLCSVFTGRKKGNGSSGKSASQEDELASNRTGNETTESLLNRQSHTGSSGTTPANHNLFGAPGSGSAGTDGSNSRGNPVDFMRHLGAGQTGKQRRRRRNSRVRKLMNKWCTCCCTNAPWQREQRSDIDDDDYNIAHRSTSLSDDDVHSGGLGSGGRGFESPPHAVFASASSPDRSVGGEEATVESETRYSAFPTGSLNDGLRFGTDDGNTSEYEYQDNDVTPPAITETSPAVRPTTLHPNFHKYSPAAAAAVQTSTFGGTQLSGINRNPYMRQHMPTVPRQGYNQQQQQRALTQQPPVHREPPPFPKTSAYGYQPRTLPHFATQQRVPLTNPYMQQQQRQGHFAYNQHHTQQRHPASFAPTFNEHYVSLQPQLRPGAGASRTMGLGPAEGRLERRDSFYDNSLPRDSPLYEYYQRQGQGRQELPGTKNINQYFQ